MATSSVEGSSIRSRRSAASSAASVRNSQDVPRRSPSQKSLDPTISIDNLVNHLLAAKRSLSSMTHVLRANEITNRARTSHEDAIVISFQTCFIRDSIMDQSAILTRLRGALQATYDWGKKDFKKLVRLMDESDGALEKTMNMLRNTEVHSGLRPPSETEKKNLVNFVDEESVHGMREAMKKSIEELQGIQQSFDSDLLRFDTDIRNLKKIIATVVPTPPMEEDDGEGLSMTERLERLVDNSSNMAGLLASLTKHFDMCVTAIRTTEGAVAVARRKAAEARQSQDADGVSISGVIAEQESNLSDLEPKTAEDRAEMLRVVVQDATEVSDVVQEMQDLLTAMEHDGDILESQVSHVKSANAAVLEAFTMLGDIGERLASYMATGEYFRERWDLEKDTVHSKLQEMDGLREFYERYAGAYDSLVLEMERRRAVEDRIHSIWRKAQENVDKLLEADNASRQAFKDDVGEFLPTDLWHGMQAPAKGWEVVQVNSHVDDGEEQVSL